MPNPRVGAGHAPLRTLPVGNAVHVSERGGECSRLSSDRWGRRTRGCPDKPWRYAKRRHYTLNAVCCRLLTNKCAPTVGPLFFVSCVGADNTVTPCRGRGTKRNPLSMAPRRVLRTLAEEQGFEPWNHVSAVNRLAGGRTRPLCDSSRRPLMIPEKVRRPTICPHSSGARCVWMRRLRPLTGGRNQAAGGRRFRGS